jgi:hypothetical protein
MNKMLRFALLILFLGSVHSSFGQYNKLRIYDTVLFYDGYASLASIATKPAPPAGIVRLSTSLYTRKLTSSQLAAIGDSLFLKVIVKASCDNYDRIAQVGLAFVPKGDTTYDKSKVKRIELARFITPFMNKNRKPDTVPYDFTIHNVASILKEKHITDSFDIWFELGIFGVPYAAQTEVAGCAGRNDVFYGTVDLYTNSPIAPQNDNYLIGLSNQFNVNNYQVGASDSIGVTAKTITFNLPYNTEEASLYLITSNHGAGTGGEEYNRRKHFIFFDGDTVLTYTPGFTSCEPYRKYNTQGNGIYGPSVRTDATWQSFSNWCPGAIIPIRTIFLGNLLKGSHTFKLSVPTAVFNLKDGYFPLSVYLQGKVTYPVNNAISLIENSNEISLYPNPGKEIVSIQSPIKISSIEVYNMVGQQVLKSNTKSINVLELSQGMYYVKVGLENGQTIIKTLIK